MYLEDSILRSESGSVDINSKLVSFLYELMRDHLPPGKIEDIVRRSQDNDVEYTNGWLANYALNVATRLAADSDGEEETPEEESEEESSESESEEESSD
jgi:hypothetical protein